MGSKYTSRMGGAIFAAMASIWIAVVLTGALVPIWPVLGTSATITFSGILTNGLTASLLGPIWGPLSGFTYGWLIPYVNPAASIGLLTFLTTTVSALTSALLLFNRWKEALAIFAVDIAIWFLNPFAWYQAMPIITWEYWLAVVLIVVSPVRKWMINAITTRNPSTLPFALWCFAWISRMGEVVTGNNIFVWVNNFTGPGNYVWWVPVTVYYAIADSLTCVAAAILGTGVLLALKRSNIRAIALDSLAPKK